MQVEEGLVVEPGVDVKPRQVSIQAAEVPRQVGTDDMGLAIDLAEVAVFALAVIVVEPDFEVRADSLFRLAAQFQSQGVISLVAAAFDLLYRHVTVVFHADCRVGGELERGQGAELQFGPGSRRGQSGQARYSDG